MALRVSTNHFGSYESLPLFSPPPPSLIMCMLNVVRILMVCRVGGHSDLHFYSRHGGVDGHAHQMFLRSLSLLSRSSLSLSLCLGFVFVKGYPGE